ncbi:MAG: glycogen/starch synthase [Ferruginibacter sp.]|nr:glycogen/starch synthase [Ferruginibacter sp.]
MEILHVSAECYPMAKAGGLADVVGALPKYQQHLGHIAKVVMPMHRTEFLYDNEWEVVHKGYFSMAHYNFDFTIIREKTNKLHFDLYCVDIHGLLDREKIYGYDDDTERFMAFQIAVTEWLSKWEHHPDVIHVHDHHAALVPFMMQQCFAYRHLARIPTILTIHNAQYQGWMGWDKVTYIPAWDTWKWGLLDWANTINPLACGIKCADKVSTVSPGYMNELMYAANGLENLFNYEKGKCSGILNGIDYSVWDPAIDTYILDNYSISDFEDGKALNKKKLCDDFGFDIQNPLFVFIGRLVNEKAADLLPQAFRIALEKAGGKCSFLVLGSGETAVEQALQQIQHNWIGFYNSQIGYNEKLSHQMYAGADFLLMPSRVEPCGLNQMYAMRYGTVPVVRSIGGLKDTVIDYGGENGYGICFNHASVDDIVYSIGRGRELYNNKITLAKVRKTMMMVNNSWETSARKYIDLYKSIYK